MTTPRLSPGKTQRLQELSTPDGIIAALALDQRKSLRSMMAAGANTDIADSALVEFKSAVSRTLTPHVSAILLDPDYGGEAMKQRAPGCGLLVTYELDGYENPRPHRMLALLPQLSVRRIAEMGGQAVKILLSWAPHDDEQANDEKRALIERIGCECDALDMPFFLEPLTYDPHGSDPRSTQWARQKPELVVQTMEEFSRPTYRVDVLKVEFPVTAAFATGTWSKAEALAWFRAADSVSRVPYIYLSAGIGSTEFRESLQLAAEAGTRFSGVLCGRATWQDGVREYARSGRGALANWLAAEGVKNVQGVNECLRAATPWQARRQT